VESESRRLGGIRSLTKLVYSAISSLDGYVADADGRWDWSVPDEEVHTFVNDLQRPLRTHLYGRRMYEVLRAWEDMDVTNEPPCMAEFAEIWRGAEKIVFSRTLESVSSARTRIERDFDPDLVREIIAQSEGDVLVAGPGLAAQAMKAGLVDEIQLFLAPAVVGGGTRSLPDDIRLDLELLHERRFGNGTVYLRYRVAGSPRAKA
jgi:dihydrofolate reductase